MSEAKEDSTEQSNASGCSHGGEQRTEVSDRSHETGVCPTCEGFGKLLGSRWGEYHGSKCYRCRGTGLVRKYR